MRGLFSFSSEFIREFLACPAGCGEGRLQELRVNGTIWSHKQRCKEALTEMIMKDLKLWLGPMRVDFLYLDVACVLLGTGAAVWTHGKINILYLILAFVGAVCAHISVNALNEYLDFKSGLDLQSEPTPFSGGSGTLRERPDMAPIALGIGVGCLVITALIGLYFLVVRGWALLPLGVLGLLVIVVYTSWITHYPLLSLIVTGLGFGLLMVTGTYYVLTGEYTWTAFFASLAPFFLGNDLLLLNQFPDVEVDQAVGRRNLPIVIGRQASSVIYGLFLLATYLSIVAGVWLGYLPALSLLGLLTLPLAVITAVGVYRYAEDLPRLMPYMGFNVLLNIATPVLMAIGLLIAA
jgi:1,4-dihydroxy-2-naphthoate octaprenyltransferase